MYKLIDNRFSGKLSRRDFLKGSAAAAEHSIPEDVESKGEWIMAACWHNCGGRCMNKALVVDGGVVRQKTDDTHEDSPEYPQQRACVQERSQRNHIFGADRLRYPIKRKNWSPDDPHGELRGIDKWEPITWGEALDYVADEIKKAIENYGNLSIWGRGTEVQRFFNHIGGCTRDWGTTSLGSYTLTPPLIGTTYDDGADRLSMQEADYCILWGLNPGWSSAGNPLYNYLQAKKAGVKFIGVDPFYNESHAVLEAEWIPCRPSMDTAMMIGVAYEMLQLDNGTGDVIDYDFLNSCTIGFDAEHMPEGADPNHNFKDYVLGTHDGVAKDAAWAAELWRAVNTGKYNFVGNGGVRQAGEIRDIDIHVLYHGWNAILQSRDGMTEGIKAHRKVDFVVCHAHALKTEALYSDIVLPVDSEWERCGTVLSGNREVMFYTSQVTPQLFGAKSDQ